MSVDATSFLFGVRWCGGGRGLECVCMFGGVGWGGVGVGGGGGGGWGGGGVLSCYICIICKPLVLVNDSVLGAEQKQIHPEQITNTSYLPNLP